MEIDIEYRIKKNYSLYWLSFFFGVILAFITVYFAWGVQVYIFMIRTPHYWLILLIPFGFILTLIDNVYVKYLGFFLLGFGLSAFLTDIVHFTTNRGVIPIYI